MIYFIRSVKTGHIKIGTTQDLKQRLSSLTVAFGELEVLGILPGGRPFEKALHMAFREYAVPGAAREWFLDTPRLQKYIDAYTWSWDKQKRAKPKRLRLNPPQYGHGVNCHLYDLIVQKRRESGFEDFGVKELAGATGVSVARIKLLAANKCREFINKEIDSLLDFFDCQVDDMLKLDA